MGEHFWAAFAGDSGQTHLINDATAYLLQALSVERWTTLDDLASAMQAGTEAGLDDVRAMVAQSLLVLEDTGLVALRRGPGVAP